LGCGEGSALLATASLDRTVKLWSLATGQLLRTITLPAGVTSVTLDAGEHVLLAGCVDGSIWEAALAGQQLAAPAAAAAGSSAAAGASDAAAAAAAAAGVLGGPGSCCYEGHSKAISSLAITPDGEQLVSGRPRFESPGSCFAAVCCCSDVQCAVVCLGFVVCGSVT
jgi:WD40 repeat protein